MNCDTCHHDCRCAVAIRSTKARHCGSGKFSAISNQPRGKCPRCAVKKHPCDELSVVKSRPPDRKRHCATSFRATLPMACLYALAMNGSIEPFQMHRTIVVFATPRVQDSLPGTSRHFAARSNRVALEPKETSAARQQRLARSKMTHFRPVGQFEQQLPCVGRFRACRSFDHFPSGFPLEGTRHEWWTNVHG